MMRGNVEYGRFGQYLMNDRTAFLDNPNAAVASNMWVSALWKYMIPQGNKPSLHQIALNHFYPNEVDKDNGIYRGYGTLTAALYGNRACGANAVDGSIATNAFGAFTQIVAQFGVLTHTWGDTLCKDFVQWSIEGDGCGIPHYWKYFSDIDGNADCRLVRH